MKKKIAFVFCVFVLFNLADLVSAQNVCRSPYVQVQLDKCGLDKLLGTAETPAEAEKLKELYLQMEGAMNDLANYRNQFLTSRRLIDIFPTAYFHTTQSEMKLIRNGIYEYPAEKLNQLLAFYDAYKVNRENWERGNLAKVDTHWLTHYKKVTEIDAKSFRTLFDLETALSTSVDAHVNYDLSRAIAYAFKHRINKDLGMSDLQADFDNTDAIFGQTVSNVNRDVVQTLSLTILDQPLKQFALFVGAKFKGDGEVIEGRHQAWNDAAAGRGTYRSKLAQPVTDHQKLQKVGETNLCEDGDELTLEGGYDQNGLDTGINLLSGDLLSIKATGEIVLGMWAGKGGPDGIKFSTYYSYEKNILHGALIYRTEEGSWTLAGSNLNNTIPNDGVLKLNVNDNDFENNRGGYKVRITVCRKPELE
ncbi:DUF5995 family protein [Dyadobacter diqingensis]|uniref:DUF5995 family protein n=1 Tax=Dyadobacter diqingensis TaxID=2938121 RepID=UPI0020C19E94|nr:DUF5995 family protein [Dyadobacter diqingensis]